MMVKQLFLYGLLSLASVFLVSCANPINQAAYFRYMDYGQQAMVAGDMVEAEKNFSRALLNAESGHLPPEDKMITLLRLGEITQFQGKYDEAANYLEQSLPFAEEAYGMDGGPTGEMLLALAIVYLDQDEVKKGIDLLPRIESIYVKNEAKTTDSDRFKLSSKWVFNGYARELSKLGRTTEAESLKLLAAGIAIDYVDLGKRASNTGLWGLGAIAFTAALEGEQRHELSEKEKSSALYGLGVVKNLQGKYEEGADLLKRALVIDERLYGFDGFNVGYTVGELAISYYKKNKIDEGLALIPQATAIYQKHSEKYSPQARFATRSLFSVYANELHKLGRELEAKQLENLAESIMVFDPEELLLWGPQ